jgi:hypothetical protein
MWILAVIFDLFVALLSGGDAAGSWTADLKNRNDRGLLKKPSDEYVC